MWASKQQIFYTIDVWPVLLSRVERVECHAVRKKHTPSWKCCKEPDPTDKSLGYWLPDSRYLILVEQFALSQSVAQDFVDELLTTIWRTTVTKMWFSKMAYFFVEPGG